MARQLLSSHKATDPQGDALAVLEFQSPTSALIATPVPRSARSVSFWIGLAVIASITSAGFIKIDKVVMTQGKLVSTEPTTQIQPLDTAIVRAVYVQPGQRVKKGQLLAELDPTFATANLKADQDQVDSYTAQIERTEAQLSGKPYVPSTANPSAALQLETYNQLQAQYTAGVANFDQQIAALRAQLAQSEADIRQYAQRLELANNVEAMRQQLQKMQVGSRLDSLSAADNRLSMAGQLADAQTSANKSVGDIASIQAQRDTYIQQWNANLSQQLQQAQNNLAPIQQNLTKDHLVHQLVMIKAPEDAIVLNIGQISVGSVLQAGQQFISLTPLGTALDADIMVDGSNVGYLNVGDKVDLKLASLPYLQYGKLEGQIEYVSSDSFNPQQVQSGNVMDVTGNTPQGLFYMARVKILQNDLHNTPQGFELSPGMPLSGEVKVGKRTVLDYMMKRILPAFSEGMREPN